MARGRYVDRCRSAESCRPNEERSPPPRADAWAFDLIVRVLEADDVTALAALPEFHDGARAIT